MHKTGLAPEGKRREKPRLVTSKDCSGMKPPSN